jgi:putative transposase
MVEWAGEELPVRAQAELLGVNRTGLYYKPVGPSAAEIALKHRIDEIYTERPFYGSRRIAADLRREGREVNRKAVRRHMREMGISAIYPGPNLSKRKHDEQVFPYLLRGIKADHPDHVWGTDVTYVRLVQGWMYLVVFLDWYSRYVVSWELDQAMEESFVLRATSRALSQGKPEIVNSDQGSQYTSPQYVELLKGAGVQISMDGRGRGPTEGGCHDNIFTERLWRSVKYEEVYLNEYHSPRGAREGLRRYFEFYNNRRPHQALGYRTPAEVYLERKNEEMIAGS